jgi:uncharacterized protein (DUF2235 family)
VSKRIIVLSDGTGNSAAKVWRTNVWRTFEAIDLSGSGQVAFYDDGVGTSSFKPLAILGGAFGYGLKRNVIELYKFICRNYKTAAEYQALYQRSSTDDELFAFGFSRGAFTIRVLVGLVLDQGLVSAETEGQLDSLAREAYRNYRARRFHTSLGVERPFRFVRDLLMRRLRSGQIERSRRVKKIRFLGLWDTVAAYGLPVDEMTRGVSRYLWPLELPNHRLDPDRIERACHALSLDDQRTTFHPVLWDESNLPTPPSPRPQPYATKQEKVTQIWFAGVHANVGGGYPDDSLAYIPMVWIWKEAHDCGLVFKETPTADPDALLNAQSKKDKDGRLYDSRSGFAGYYRYGPRNVYELCNFQSSDPRDCVSISRSKIHESVFQRIAIGAHSYAPISLPPIYDVVTYNAATGDHEIVSVNAPYREGDAAAAGRFEDQERVVWSMVWRGRGFYFLTVLASLYFVVYPLADPAVKTAEFTTRLRLVSDAIRLIAIVLPSGADRWVDAYASDPVLFLISVTAIGLLLYVSAGIRSRITDQMRHLFAGSLARPNNLQQSATVSEAWRPSGMVDHITIFLLIFAVGIGLAVNSFVTWPPDSQNVLIPFLRRIPAFLGLLALIALILLFTPTRTVARLRAWPKYKSALRMLRLRWAPAFFAVLFLFWGLEFASHYVVNVRDSFGEFCPRHDNVTESTSEIDTTCDQGDTRKCFAPGPCNDSTGKTVACPSRTVLFDTSELCTATSLYVNRNQRYHVYVRKATSGEINEYMASHPNTAATATTWRQAGLDSTPGGVTFTQLGDWRVPSCDLWLNWESMGSVGRGLRTACNYVAGKVRQTVGILVYPLKRTFDRPLGRFVLRYGSTGNEENPIDPDIPPQGGGSLDEVFSPTSQGELYLYLNEPILGFWPSAFHRFNSGIASVTVVRIRPKN